MPWRSEVWVLTGDKVDTAISIAMSCKLLTEDMNNFIIDNTTEQRLEQRSDGVDGTDCGFEVFLTWGLPIPSEKHIFIQQETSRNTNLNPSCWHGMGCCQMRISNTWKDHWHPARCLGSWESGADHRRTEGIPIIVQSSRALTLRVEGIPTILQRSQRFSRIQIDRRHGRWWKPLFALSRGTAMQVGWVKFLVFRAILITNTKHIKHKLARNL